MDASGWQFAGHAFSPKGVQLARHPRAALTFYWPEHGRPAGLLRLELRRRPVIVRTTPP
ncbi:hypothetical protein [Streptomyces sp. NBC_00435]|uniref:hypothetical protein n=1 Tax=Streptomyces sp. NBC_00435 TaxID=2903649 RepID=UPI003FA728A8